MSSVSELNSYMDIVFDCGYSKAAQHSRSLISSGLLPKSSGRAVAKVSVEDAIRLFIAVGLDRQYNETASAVEEYCQLLHDGVPHSAPDTLKNIALDRLKYTFLMVIAPQAALPEELELTRRAELDLEYEIVMDWPQVLAREGGEIVEDFRASGLAAPGHWNNAVRRSFIFHGRAFDDFDDFDFGLDLSDWAKEIRALEARIIHSDEPNSGEVE